MEHSYDVPSVGAFAARTGKFRIVVAATLVSVNDDPIELDFGLPEEPREDWMTIRFKFVTDAEVQGSKMRAVDESNDKLLVLELVNFSSPLGTSIPKPFQFGEALGYELSLLFEHRLNNNFRTIIINILARPKNAA